MNKMQIRKPRGYFEVLVNNKTIADTNLFTANGFTEIFTPGLITVFDKNTMGGLFAYCHLGFGGEVTPATESLSGTTVNVGLTRCFMKLIGEDYRDYELYLEYTFPTTISGTFNQLMLSPSNLNIRSVCGKSFEDTVIVEGDTVKVCYRVNISFGLNYYSDSVAFPERIMTVTPGSYAQQIRLLDVFRDGTNQLIRLNHLVTGTSFEDTPETMTVNGHSFDIWALESYPTNYSKRMDIRIRNTAVSASSRNIGSGVFNQKIGRAVADNSSVLYSPFYMYNTTSNLFTIPAYAYAELNLSYTEEWV